MRRVVITGVGPITSIGIGKEKFWAAIKEKRPGINPVSKFDPSIFKATSAGEVLDWKPEEYFFPHRLKRWDRYAQFAVASVNLALRDSGLTLLMFLAGVGVAMSMVLGLARRSLGIIHQEFHSRDFTQKGGTLEMVQLWVNLRAKDKNAKPGYQTLLKTQIPNVSLPHDAGNVRIIAGEYDGSQGAARTFTPINLLDVSLRAGNSAELPLPDGHTTAALVLYVYDVEEGVL